MRRYTLAQLEALRCVVVFRGFQAAADHLKVTQPTISLRIRELETIVGYSLLRRSGGRGELTPEGAAFYQHVEQLTRTLGEMDRRIRTRDPLRGVLRMGASDTFAIGCLPDLLTKMDAIYPDLRIELTITSSTTLAELLTGRKLDIAFMAERLMEPEIHVHPLSYCRMAWFGRSRDGRRSRPITAADLDGERLMTLPINSPLRSMMVEWFEASRHRMPPVSVCNSLGIVLRLINAGHAWSILPEFFTLSNDGTKSSPVAVVPELPKLKLCAAYRTESNVDTLMPVVDLVKGILVSKPGLLPLE